MTSIRNYIIVFLCVMSLSSWAQTTEMEQRYNALAARFEVRDKQLAKDLKAYLQAFPYTTFADEVKFMQGVLQVEKGQNKQGLKTLESIDLKALTRPHQLDYTFYRGYAYLMQQDYHKASIYFGQLSKSDTRYATRGTYYYGYCLYKEQKYEQALPVFKKLENEAAYSKTVPYYIVQIEYALGHHEEAVTRAETLLREHPEALNNSELHRILGESYYLKGDYKQATTHLQQYHKAATENKEELLRNDIFMLGVAAYQLGEYEACVKYLKQVKQEKDTLSEAACLTMGNAYVEMAMPEQAKLSFQAAASYGLTPAIQEEAAYNYTLCTYESSSALGESVRAFNDFLHQFPNSKYESKVYQLLSDALMQSKNYAAAISVLDSISNPTPKMLKTKQYLRYQLGADNFLQGKMQQAIDWMSEVINHTEDASDYTTEAYYVRAEAAYRLRNYMACEKDLKTFFLRPDARQSSNYAIAKYLQGYCYFSQQQYDKAQEVFSSYLDVALATEPTYADALNRIGDCYFNARQFPQAISYYSQVSNLQASGADYALFQRGYALGLQHKYAEKISVMRELTTRYPKSDYADDGVYETARAQLQLEDERGAIVTYEQLLATYPHSTLARKASLERAMLYRNLHQNDQAIAAYRQTIEKYPATEEAYTALDAFQYCSGGRYCTTARYYLADSYYRLGKNGEALAQYAILAEMNANPYQEEAATRVAEICYDKGDFSCALEGFYRLQALASSRENTLIARLGILRCSQALGRHQAVIDVADMILGDQPISDDMRTEALYGRAKAYIGLNQWKNAQPDLTTLSKEVRTAQGAEAKYLLAQSYFELKDLEAAEAQVMEFTQMNTQQQYWLARALILLSDINRERGEYFQARQYLLVLQQNYLNKTDGIHSLLANRLDTLDQLEKPVVKEEVEDEE